MRSHLQFRAVLDNAVIRLEMQKSSLKLNHLFVTVLRGADCLKPCWSLDLEYFDVVLAVKRAKITLEHPRALWFWGGGFRTGLQVHTCPSHIVWCCLVFAALTQWGCALSLNGVHGDGSGPGVCPVGNVGVMGGRSRAWICSAIPLCLYIPLASQSGSCPLLGGKVPSQLLGSRCCFLLSSVQRASRVSWSWG